MATVLSRRLGKRSLLGTRVAAPDGILAASQIPELGRAPAPHEDGSCSRVLEESGRAPAFPNPGLRQLRGQQVLLTALDEPSQGFPACWRVPDALQPPSLPNSVNPGPAEALQRSVSSSIDVPKRKADAAVEMDEMVAAMVLTSLSCSPAVQSPDGGGLPPPRAACEAWKESGDVSDSGSSSSGRGSAGSAAPSPPRPSGTARSSPAADDGFDTDCEPFPRDEPAPRRRKNSVVFKCLWPGCGKELRSVVGIKRHVRTRHLRDGPDSEPRKQEEDFYYTEVQVKEEPPAEAPPASAAPGASPGATAGATSPASCSAPIAIRPALAPPEPGPCPPALSHSAPGSFWHIQADHAYQALPSIQIPVSPHIFTSISWAAATSTLPSLSPVRSRSLSLSEPQPPPPPPLLKPQLLVASPPRLSLSTRKVRGEAKKCRKVYGIEHRDQWCTACRWKKACQRFLD